MPSLISPYSPVFHLGALMVLLSISSFFIRAILYYLGHFIEQLTMKAKRQSKGQVAQRLLQEVTHLAFHSDQITTFNLGIGIWCFLSDRRRGGGGETFVQSSEMQQGTKDLLPFFCIVIHWKTSINCFLTQAWDFLAVSRRQVTLSLVHVLSGSRDQVWKHTYRLYSYLQERLGQWLSYMRPWWTSILSPSHSKYRSLVKLWSDPMSSHMPQSPVINLFLLNLNVSQAVLQQGRNGFCVVKPWIPYPSATDESVKRAWICFMPLSVSR